MPNRIALGRMLPNVDLLTHYRRAWLRDDVLAGITVAAYLVPQVMGYAQVAGLAPVTGLWTIMVSLTVYAIVGTSRQLSVGPESTTALMTASIVGSLAAGDPARYIALASALAVMVGFIAILAWIVRLGFLADLLSKPVLVGYMAGVAVLMIVGQLGKITGVDVDGDSTVAELRSFIANIADTNAPTLVLALTTLGTLLALNRISKKVPAPLIGVLASTAAVAIFSLDKHGVAVIGGVPRGLPGVHLPDLGFGDISSLLLPALSIAVVGYSDNMLTARAFGVRHNHPVDANQEWLALGVANVGAGLVRGYPVSSSGSRTAIGDSLGSRTQLHSLVAVTAVAVTLLFAGPLLELFPVAALGAIVIYAALRLIDIAAFRRLAGFQRTELAIAAVATIGVVLVGPLYGVLLAVSLSVIALIRRVARPHDGILGFVPGVAGMHDIDDYASAELVPGLLVYRYDAPLFFVNAENFRERALGALDRIDGDELWFVLNAEANVEADITAIDALDQLHDELARRGIVFALARVKRELYRDLAAAGLIERVGSDKVFATLPTAVHAYLEWYTERHGAPPPGVVVPEPPPPPKFD